MEIKAILFDMGGVMVNCDTQTSLTAFAMRIGKPYEDVYATLVNEDLFGPFELGELSAQEYYEQIKTALDCEISYELFVESWNSILKEFPESTQMVSDLRDRYKLIALSNTNELHQKYMQDTFMNLRGLHDWVTSCDVGAAKPDSHIYELAAQRTGVSKDQILYVDDRKEFVDAGRRCGLMSVHCYGPVQLQSALTKLGILKNERALY